MGTAPPATGLWRPGIVMDHREMLRLAGEALYGERWQSELSRAVGVSDRTMRRWVSDPYEIPGGVWNDIQQLLLARGVAIEKLRNEIMRAIPDAPTSMKDDRPMMPTVNDRQIFSELPFNNGKLYTAGNVDRRRWIDRLAVGPHPFVPTFTEQLVGLLDQRFALRAHLRRLRGENAGHRFSGPCGRCPTAALGGISEPSGHPSAEKSDRQP